MGVKTGKPRGRPVGVQNRKIREIAETARTEGVTPLEALLIVMRRGLEEADDQKVLDAAGRAAPYIHPKMPTALEVSGPDGNPIQLSLIDRLQRGIARVKGSGDAG